MNTQSMLPVGTMLRGIYRIESYLASGGFGNTYVVRNVEFDEVYALKEFYIKGVCQRDGDSTIIGISNNENTELFTQQLDKFKKEARRIRSLKSNHIVRVYDLFEENGTAYCVMDFVDGESLSSRLSRTKSPLKEDEVKKLLPQILDGLQSIHTVGIFHLDIKPANIMVDKSETVKLIDFGASKQQSNYGRATTISAFSYTNGYAPIEQMAQKLDCIGPWTDFYALGATLYKLLTLKNPPSVTELSEDESVDKHNTLPMSRVSSKMKSLIVWMMQEKRSSRPQSVEEILSSISDAESSKEKEKVQDEDTEKLKNNKRKYREIYRVFLAVMIMLCISAFVGFVAYLALVNKGDSDPVTGGFIAGGAFAVIALPATLFVGLIGWE